MASAPPFSPTFAVHCLEANVGNSLTAQHVSAPAPAPAPASDGSSIDQGIAYVDVSMFVSLISIWGFFGRIGAGFISEHFLRRDQGIPKYVLQILVGCDGVYSVVARYMGLPPARSSGRVAIRGIVTHTEDHHFKKLMVQVWGKGARAGFLTCSDKKILLVCNQEIPSTSGQDLTVIHQMGAAILPQGSLHQIFQSMVYGQIIMMAVTLLTLIPAVPLILHR